MKCHRYWPDPTSSPPAKKAQYGSVFVTHKSSVPHKHFIVRTFEVEFEGEVRELKQFAYTSWPDHGVPLTTGELLGFRNAVRISVKDPNLPLLIHCSAGVGRTGTYIAIDRLVQQALDMGGQMNVDAIVSEMRMARNVMVQTEVQYMFIYRAVLDCLSELLTGESKKVSAAEMARAAEEAARVEMEKAQEAAEREEREKQAREVEEAAKIEEAKAELAASEAAAGNQSASAVGLSIKARMALLANAEERWLESYRQSMEEWNERNQFAAEDYDVSSALTPIQSRIEALRQKGMA
jgi:protein-tyrosine phosphatase